MVPVPVAGVEPARPTGQPLLRRSCLPIPPHWQKKKGSGNKQERQPHDHSAPNQRDTRTPATPPASPTRVRGHSQPANPDRPNLLTNTESILAQTPKRHPHTPSAPPMPPHPLRDSTRSREHPPCCFRSPVGVAGLEPAASSSRTKRATKLRHTPKNEETNFSFPLSSYCFLSVGLNHSTITRHCQHQSRVWDRPHNTPLLTLPQLTLRDSCELGLLKPRHQAKVQRLPILSRLSPIVGRLLDILIPFD